MYRFSIRAAVNPQTLPRIVDQLARQWVTPTTMAVDRDDDELRVIIQVGDLSVEKAELVAATLASCVLVQGVELDLAAEV